MSNSSVDENKKTNGRKLKMKWYKNAWIQTQHNALRMTCGRCTNVIMSNDAPALPPPYAPPEFIFIQFFVFIYFFGNFLPYQLFTVCSVFLFFFFFSFYSCWGIIEISFLKETIKKTFVKTNNNRNDWNYFFFITRTILFFFFLFLILIPI